MSSTQWLTDETLTKRLTSADLDVEGRLSDASNTTLRCRIDTGDDRDLRCVYKPVAGERPLWDFPEWTLARRELATFALSEALGWDLVPPTVWRTSGPGGSGMCQLWIDVDPAAQHVSVVRPGRAPDGWLHVLDAEDATGRPVELVHSPAAELARMAVLDILANNADRKGGHVLTDQQGHTWAIDHGVTFAVEEKLRTVLWGWAGEQVADDAMTDVARLHALLASSYDPVDRWLADDEREALRSRVLALVERPEYPFPSGRWPAVPWPVF
jgi:uncharacterized repeat protein (TIGR03843 family)